MTNKCGSSNGNPTFVVYYWGGWLTIPFVSCYGRPQLYSSFAVMCGPSRTARSLLCGALAIQFVRCYGGPSQTVCSQLCGFFGGGAVQFVQIMLSLNVPSFQTHPYPSTPSPFFFQFSLSFFLQFLLSFLAGCLFGAFMQKCQFYWNRVIKASFFEKYAALTVNFWEILSHETVVFQKQNRKK